MNPWIALAIAFAVFDLLFIWACCCIAARADAISDHQQAQRQRAAEGEGFGLDPFGVPVAFVQHHGEPDSHA